MRCKWEIGPDNEYAAYWCDNPKNKSFDMDFEPCTNEMECFEL